MKKWSCSVFTTPFTNKWRKKVPLLLFYPSDLRKIALELELLLFDTIWRL